MGGKWLQLNERQVGWKYGEMLSRTESGKTSKRQKHPK